MSEKPEKYGLQIKQRDFARRLALLHAEAGRIELYATMHKIHEAVKQVGYEIAGTPELYDRMEELTAAKVR